MRTKILISGLLCGLLILIAMSTMADQTADTWLGVYAQTIDDDLMEAFGLDNNRGALIKQVIPGSPADQAGLEQGDIIIKIGNKKLIDSKDLSETVLGFNPGEEVDIIIIRDGKKETIAATLGSGGSKNYEAGKIFKWFAKPHHGESYRDIPHHGSSHNCNPLCGESHSKSNFYKFVESDYNNTYIGLNLESLNEQLGEHFGVKNGNGILITEILEDSPAEKAGLKAGDVIIKVDGAKVAEISDIQKAVREKKEGEEIEIAFLRNKKKKKLSVEVAEAPASYAELLIPNLSNQDKFHFFAPEMNEMFHGDWDRENFSSDANKKAMKKMQSEIENLKKELQEIKNKIN